LEIEGKPVWSERSCFKRVVLLVRPFRGIGAAEDEGGKGRTARREVVLEDLRRIAGEKWFHHRALQRLQPRGERLEDEIQCITRPVN
jgi:hypothetical protein